jgi:hypothetical protein
MTYIKTSSLPLIKELTAGTQLDALREYLDNNLIPPKIVCSSLELKLEIK